VVIDLQNDLLLDARDITHKFDYDLFEDINLSLKKGQSIAITGESGSGKSTLLHILSSLLKPDNGKIIYNNDNIYDSNTDELLNIRKNHFGIIFQAHYLFRGFSAIENLKISELLCDNDIDEKMLAQFKIDKIMNQQVGELSGGQQQRVSIVRILTKKPKVIFADEPTGNLDEDTSSEVMSVLFDYVKQNDAGIILVTHDKTIANQCDTVFKIENYKLKLIKGQL
jgi:putative ABC transport system ATP-binding protein